MILKHPLGHCIFLMGLLMPITTWGNSRVLVKSPQASPTEYAAHVAVSEDFQSPVENHLQKIPQQKARKVLIKALSEAQRAYFSASQEQAKQAFEIVAGLATQADWLYEDRKAIFQSLVRLAQLSREDGEKNRWLKAAKAFAPDLEPDAKLFPPPLLEDYFQTPLETLTWKVSSLEGIDVVLINGRHYEIKPDTEISVSRSPQRVTFLSNSFWPQTKIISGQDLIHFQLETLPYVKGDCETVVWPQPVAQNWLAYFPGSCVSDGRAVPEEIHNVDLKPQWNPRSALAHSLPEKPKEVSQSWWRNKWLWVGIGVASAALIYQKINERDRSEEKYEPTVKEGF